MRLRVVPVDDPAAHIDLTTAVMRLFGYLTNAIISWILMFPTAKALARLTGSVGDLATAAAVLVVILLPYLLILGVNHKGLEDRFSRSMVIKVDR